MPAISDSPVRLFSDASSLPSSAVASKLGLKILTGLQVYLRDCNMINKIRKTKKQEKTLVDKTVSLQGPFSSCSRAQLQFPRPRMNFKSYQISPIQYFCEILEFPSPGLYKLLKINNLNFSI